MEIALPQILVHAAFGAACALIADSRGRSGVAWFFLGFFLTCIALVLVCVLPDLRKDRERIERFEHETRRLHARVTKERHVADKRYADVQRRLGVHDDRLRVDTAPSDDPDLLGEPPPVPPPAIWYYVEGRERRGPVAIPVLRRLWEERQVGPGTLVWKAGMDDWAELRDVPELGEQFGA